MLRQLRILNINIHINFATNYLNYISMSLTVGSKCEMAQERQARFYGLNDAKIICLSNIPVVCPVARWNKRLTRRCYFINSLIEMGIHPYFFIYKLDFNLILSKYNPSKWSVLICYNWYVNYNRYFWKYGRKLRGKSIILNIERKQTLS